MSVERLSVPVPVLPPRKLTDTETSALKAVADVLIPAGARGEPAATAEPGFDDTLLTAMNARADAFDALIGFLSGIDPDHPEDVSRVLREAEQHQPEIFQPVSAIVAGAWLLLPAVRERIGYPGQLRNLAPLDQIVDELATGILDPVLERGYIYVDAGE
jgi:hypothetical protein